MKTVVSQVFATEMFKWETLFFENLHDNFVSIFPSPETFKKLEPFLCSLEKSGFNNLAKSINNVCSGRFTIRDNFLSKSKSFKKFCYTIVTTPPLDGPQIMDSNLSLFVFFSIIFKFSCRSNGNTGLFFKISFLEHTIQVFEFLDKSGNSKNGP